MVDERRVAFSVGVELSYLTEHEQRYLYTTMGLDDKTPSLSQAIQMKRLSQIGRLTSATIERIISEEKPNQKEKISFNCQDLTKFFPENFTPKDIEQRIIKLIEEDYRRRQIYRNREER